MKRQAAANNIDCSANKLYGENKHGSKHPNETRVFPSSKAVGAAVTSGLSSDPAVCHKGQTSWR